jgi:curli biogenesis system outer membrane secretion channel CsgG
MDSKLHRPLHAVSEALRWAGALALVCIPTASLSLVLFAQAAPLNKSTQDAKRVPDSESSSDSERLRAIKRICVVKLAGDERIAGQVQDMLVSSLFASKRFTVTENCERADAILKGTTAESKERLSRYEDEGIGFGKRVGGVSGSWDRSGGSVSGGSAGVAGAASETLASSTEKTNAALALRLVTKDGDIIWATVEESTGNRIKGPAADLADRAVKHLIREIEKATQPTSAKVK